MTNLNVWATLGIAIVGILMFVTLLASYDADVEMDKLEEKIEKATNAKRRIEAKKEAKLARRGSFSLKRAIGYLYALGNIAWAGYFLYVQRTCLNVRTITVYVPIIIIAISLIVIILLLITPKCNVIKTAKTVEIVNTAKIVNVDKKKGSFSMKRFFVHLISFAILVCGAIGLYHCRNILMINEPKVWIAIAMVAVGLSTFECSLFAKKTNNEVEDAVLVVEDVETLSKEEVAAPTTTNNIIKDENSISSSPAETPVEEINAKLETMNEAITKLSILLSDYRENQVELKSEMKALKSDIAKVKTNTKQKTTNQKKKTEEVKPEPICTQNTSDSQNAPRRRRRQITA